MTVEVDHRGNTIYEGCKVAYNWSGQIAVGVVESAEPAIKDGWSYKKRALIKVKAEFPKHMAGDISKVRNPKVIFEAR